MLLNGYDWAVIAGFFVLLALIPTLASLKSRGTAGDFFNSGHSMPWWLIGFSMVAATTATDSANFFTQVIRSDGMSGNWITNLPFELRRKAGDCSRVTAGPIDLI